jgi:tetratricopeptide (TPR) repeat protein
MRGVSLRVFLILVASSAWAQTRDENIMKCTSNNPDAVISGCTALLHSDHEADWVAAYIARGNAYIGMGRYDQAIADFTKAILLQPDSVMAYTSRGSAYGSAGQYDQAVADFTKAITLRPDFAMAYNNRGFVYATKGLWTEAVTEYNHAIAIQPELAITYANRGAAFLRWASMTRPSLISPN